MHIRNSQEKRRDSFSEFKRKYNEAHLGYWSNTLSEQDLAQWQEGQLQDVVKHVKENSPFYKERLGEFIPESVSLSNLSDLPFTTKDDLRDSMLDILSGGMHRSIFYYETTGTTGPATPCPRDKKESHASNMQLAMSYESILKKHFPEKDTVVGIMGPTEVHSFGDTLGDVCYKLDVCNAKIWPHSPVIGPSKSLQLMKDLEIGVLSSAPGMLLAMAKEAEKAGYDPLTDFSLRAFMMSGELCTPALKNNLHSLWGAEAYNSLYGSQEALIIAATNDVDQLMPHRLNYIIEVIDPSTGESLGNTGKGELCVTMLIAGSKPLIRYRTGDLVSIQPTGRAEIAYKYSLNVVGRVKDQMELNGNPFTAGEIEQAVLEGVEKCLGYQVIINDSSGKDTIIAKLELSKYFEGDRAKMSSRIQERMIECLGVESTVMIVEDLDEHVNLGSWFSWKEARIVDQRVATRK